MQGSGHGLATVSPPLMGQRTRGRHGRRSRRLADPSMPHRGLRAVDADIHGRHLMGVDAYAGCVQPFGAGFTGTDVSRGAGKWESGVWRR
jgi:hypothetical protein